MPDDTRNVVDEFKGVSEAAIVEALDERGSSVEIAIENTLRDFNMGSIVRTANAFGIRRIHVVGRRQWNKRGAMKTDAYMHIEYHATFTMLQEYAHREGRKIIAIDNTPDSQMMNDTTKHSRSVLLFGQEGPGLSPDALKIADSVVAIEQNGSTRSLNVAAAAAVAMYAWCHESTD